VKSFLTAFKRAFAVTSGKESLTEDEKELLNRLAKGIVDRRLSTPAIMFLESVKPLNFLGSQAMEFLRPIIGAVFRTESYEKMEKILEKRKGIECLILEIEKLESETVCKP
jgi:hypothetical protein